MFSIVAALSLDAEAASVNVRPGDDLTVLTSSLLPGDVVSFEEGIYPLVGTVYWTGMGTEEAPIVFKARVPGAEVVLQTTAGGYVVDVLDSSYLVLDGLTFEGVVTEENQPSGVHVGGVSSNVTIENCTIRNVYGTALRIDGTGTGFSIRRNEIHTTIEGSGIY